MKRLKILLLYPEVPSTFWSLTHALKFFGKRAYSPPLGLLTVAAMLPKHFERRVKDLNVQPLEQSDLEWADFVFLSAMDVQRASARRILDRCKAAGVKVVAGGPLFTNGTDGFADVDHLVLNEAELTLPAFLQDLEKGLPQGRYATPEYAPLQESPLPAYELIDLSPYGALSLQYSRGCPYQCDFCNVTALFGRRPRVKSAAQIIAELDQIYRLGWRGRIYFVDDNLMCDKRHLKAEVLPAVIQWRRGKPGLAFHTQVTINLADDQELMDLMYEAGFDWVFIGIESPEEESLSECGKRQNLHLNLPEQVRRLQHSGLQVQGGFIVGFDHDSPDIFRRQFRLIQDNGIVMAMVGLLQAVEGTQLYARLDQEGRILSSQTGNNVIDETNFVTRMDGEVLRRNYRELVRALYEPGNYYSRIKNLLAHYKEPAQKPALTREAVMGVARCFFWLGLVRRGRFHFWRVLLWTCLFKRESVQNFLGLAILGYHFRRIFEGMGGARADRDCREETGTPLAAINRPALKL
ncbi:MAG: B12-binding domain-containing radical SAM protein [Limisphaerales bacterium]